MNKRILFISLFVGILVLGVLACGASVSTANIADAYLTTDKTDAGKTTTFAQDQTFYLIARLANAPDDTKVKAEWIAVNVEGADPNTVIDSAEATGGDQTFTFNLTNSNGLWPTGNYKVNLYLNDKLDRSLEFTVQ
jgi:hypothetical protein